MHVEFKPAARLDLLHAQAWYEDKVIGLGVEFGRAVDAVVAGITRFPEGYPQVHGEIRKAVLRRFPYSLLFRKESERILVLGCFHHRRDPRAWPQSP